MTLIIRLSLFNIRYNSFDNWQNIFLRKQKYHCNSMLEAKFLSQFFVNKKRKAYICLPLVGKLKTMFSVNTLNIT